MEHCSEYMDAEGWSGMRIYTELPFEALNDFKGGNLRGFTRRQILLPEE